MKKMIVIVLILLIASMVTYANTDDLRHNFVRLHVLANSDSDADQRLKLQVRDRIIKECAQFFVGIENSREAYGTIMENLEFIRGIAQDEVLSQGSGYPVEVELVNTEFPPTQYANLALPAGFYDALRVKIGGAQGKNWFCVMFPPLCFVDGVNGQASEKTLENLKSSLTDEEYKMLTSEELPVEIRFKLADLFGTSYNNVKEIFSKIF